MIVIIILPNQLFDISNYNQLCENQKHIIIIVEHAYFFSRFKFHKLKLAYHRATMRSYYDIIKQHHKTIYVEFNKSNKLDKLIKKIKYTQIKMFDPIEKELKDEFIKKYNPIMMKSPYFLNSHEDNLAINEQLTTVRHDSFYKLQRLKYNILIEDNKPLYNRWSFDKENRLKFPRDITEPNSLKIINNKYIIEAINYVNEHFPDNYGELTNFIYPINRIDSLKWFDDFITDKLANFGKYEDAIGEEIIIGYHSAISAMMNVGLLTPQDIVDKFKNIKVSKNNIATIEGFIRQVIGWREYNYFIYDLFGDYLENNYYYKNKNMIFEKIWKCETHIPYIDNTINKVYKYAYCHHIERLMVIGNYFNLLDINTKEIYNWFMTLFIDSYDVFMIPNVYGMLLYGYIDKHKHMMTKPYISASNYILKMSDYKNGDWHYIIDSLYYDKIRKYSKRFKKIYSLTMIVNRYNKMNNNTKNKLMKIKTNYLKSLK